MLWATFFRSDLSKLAMDNVRSPYRGVGVVVREGESGLGVSGNDFSNFQEQSSVFFLSYAQYVVFDIRKRGPSCPN